MFHHRRRGFPLSSYFTVFIILHHKFHQISSSSKLFIVLLLSVGHPFLSLLPLFVAILSYFMNLKHVLSFCHLSSRLRCSKWGLAAPPSQPHCTKSYFMTVRITPRVSSRSISVQNLSITFCHLASCFMMFIAVGHRSSSFIFTSCFFASKFNHGSPLFTIFNCFYIFHHAHHISEFLHTFLACFLICYVPSFFVICEWRGPPLNTSPHPPLHAAP